MIIKKSQTSQVEVEKPKPNKKERQPAITR